MELFGSDPGIKGPNALNETEIKVRMMSDGQTSSVLALCCTLYSDGGQLNQRDEYFDTLEEKLKEQDFTVTR